MAMISPGLCVFCMAALTAAVALTASLSPAYSSAAALEFSPSHQTALRCSLAHAASSAAALPRAETVAPDQATETSVSWQQFNFVFVNHIATTPAQDNGQKWWQDRCVAIAAQICVGFSTLRGENSPSPDNEHTAQKPH